MHPASALLPYHPSGQIPLCRTVGAKRKRTYRFSAAQRHCECSTVHGDRFIFPLGLCDKSSEKRERRQQPRPEKNEKEDAAFVREKRQWPGKFWGWGVGLVENGVQEGQRTAATRGVMAAGNWKKLAARSPLVGFCCISLPVLGACLFHEVVA